MFRSLFPHEVQKDEILWRRSRNVLWFQHSTDIAFEWFYGIYYILFIYKDFILTLDICVAGIDLIYNCIIENYCMLIMNITIVKYTVAYPNLLNGRLCIVVI